MEKDEGIIKDSYEVIIGELQTLISVSYIIAIGIGMLFTFQKYQHFGINIFDFADIFDFLIAPFSDLKVLIFSVSSILLGLFLIQFDRYWKRKHPDSYSEMNFGLDKKKWFNGVRNIFYIVIILGYLYVTSNEYGKSVKEQIESRKAINIKFNDGEIKSGILIGKTSEYLFLKTSGKTVAIPVKSMVKEIEIEASYESRNITSGK